MEYDTDELPVELDDVKQASRRPICSFCGRPASVCLCSVLPSPKLATETQVIILQHPHEVRQRLATVPLLQRCLEHCHVVRGRRFKRRSCSILDSLWESAKTKERISHIGQTLEIEYASTLNNPEGDLDSDKPTQGDIDSELVLQDLNNGLGVGTQQTSQCRKTNFEDIIKNDRRPCLLLFPSPQAVNISQWMKQHRAKSRELKEVSQDNGDLTCRCSLVQPQESLAGKLPEELRGLDGTGELGVNKVLTANGLTREDGSCRNQPGQRQCELCDRKRSDSQEGYVLIVLDGTWQHAQEMMSASQAFLLQFSQLVCLPFDTSMHGPSMGAMGLIIRKEPCAGFVSTLEAVARILAVLEKQGEEIENALLQALRRMVELQQTCLLSKLEKQNACNQASTGKS